jgi:hypothetical protein
MRAEGVRNVAVDVTGGKVPMSLGAFMAAEEAALDSLYVTTAWRDGKPDASTAKLTRISGTVATARA